MVVRLETTSWFKFREYKLWLIETNTEFTELYFKRPYGKTYGFEINDRTKDNYVLLEKWNKL